jgi:hypothetical protein
VEEDATRKQAANIRMDVDVTPEAGITVALGRYQVNADTDTSPARGENDKAEKTLSTAALTGRLDLWEGLVSNKVTLFANRTERDFFEDDVSSRAGLQPQTDLFDGDRIGVEAQSDITVRTVDRLTLGARTERERGEQVTETLTGRSIAFSGEERSSAAFALAEKQKVAGFVHKNLKHTGQPAPWLCIEDGRTPKKEGGRGIEPLHLLGALGNAKNDDPQQNPQIRSDVRQDAI